jgi:hypothetical protein
MQAIRTKAVVNEQGQIHLLNSHFDLEKGIIVEVIILYQKPANARTSWQSILNSIGTYTDEELSGFAEARKELEHWQPAEF